jgi:mRNA-degrading endonuclease HigB of HigAB toxin-antitoxin module
LVSVAYIPRPITRVFNGERAAGALKNEASPSNSDNPLQARKYFSNQLYENEFLEPENICGQFQNNMFYRQNEHVLQIKIG